MFAERKKMSVRPRRRRFLKQGLLHAIIIPLIFLTFFPLVFMVMTSFKSISQFYHSFWMPSFPLHLENYLMAWNEIKIFVLNSLVITGVSTLGTVIFCSFSAFAFAQFNFRGKNILYYLIISIMMIPPILVVIPSFMWVKELGLLDTRRALILSYIAMGQAFGIFVLRSFFESLSGELFEAARIDGASIFQLYSRIAMPLSKNILAALAIINILYSWNDYVWPMVVLGTRSRMTLTVGLTMYQGQYNTQYGLLMAGFVIGSLPLIILFFFAMKHFISGMMAGALKM